MDSDGFIAGPLGKLEYQWISGDAEKPTIVLLHEGLGCVAMWKRFPQLLGQCTGCSVFNYSRYGYGGSDSCKLPRSVNYMHDEAFYLKSVLAQIPGDQFILVGHSDEASIATIFSGLNYRSDVAGLVLIAPHFVVEEVTFNAIEKIATTYQSSNLGKKLKKYHDQRTDEVFWGWNDIWLSGEFRNWNISHYLKKIMLPVLVIQSKDDEYGTMEQVETVCRLLPGSVETEILEQGGHSPHQKFGVHLAECNSRFFGLCQEFE